MTTIQKMPQPVIARVHGIATAAGCQLVAACDLAVSADDARFAVSGVNLGLFCSTPSVALSRNLSRKAALRMLLTGDFIDAREAVEQGLARGRAKATARAMPTVSPQSYRPMAAHTGGSGPITLMPMSQPVSLVAPSATFLTAPVASPNGQPSTARELPLDLPLREARDAFERAYFEHHLSREHGSMTRVAEKTGLERTHLYRKLKQLGIDLSKGAYRKSGQTQH
jgi:enoyl-CoA hydratase/carnithine racemase